MRILRVLSCPDEYQGRAGLLLQIHPLGGTDGMWVRKNQSPSAAVGPLSTKQVSYQVSPNLWYEACFVA